MIDLKKMKAICDAATAGWESSGNDIVRDRRFLVQGITGEAEEAGGFEHVGSFADANDAVFADHARTALPELVEWAEKVRVSISEASRLYDKGLHCGVTHLFFHLESLLDAVGGPTKERPRKIVQVAVAPNDSKNQGAVIAVADDGSLWAFAGGEWDRFPTLPLACPESPALPPEDPEDPDTVPREWWDGLKRYLRERKVWMSTPGAILEEMHALENGR